MGGIFYQNVESEILQSLRKDNPKRLKDTIIKNHLNPDTLYTKRKRTLVQLSCYFISPKCLSTLIKLNYDYNKKEIINNYTPLYIACKFNSLPLVKILMEKDDINILQKTTDNFNEFEIAFLKGNYDICYYLLYEYKNNEKEINEDQNNINNEKENENVNEINTISKKKKKLNFLKEKRDSNNEQPYQKFFLSKDFDLDTCLSLQNQNLFPLFNMELFYQSLLDRVPPSKCPSFAAERKKSKELMTKIPDPNETWGHFFKRLVNFELYNPPMVDKKNVSQMNSMYMNAQMKLIESEYGIKMSYYENDERNLDDSKNEENEEQPIINVKKKKIKNNENNEINNENGGNTNLIHINLKNSIKEDVKNNNNKNNENNTSIRDKDDFYALDVHNTSERKIVDNQKM